MRGLVRDQRDFWSGVIFIAFGIAAVFIGRDYPMGTAGRMGPGYFPAVLGCLLAVIGATGVLRALFRTGTEPDRFAVTEAVKVLSAILLFGVFVRGGGLVVSIIVLVMVSGLASVKFKASPYLILAVGLAVFCVLVFIKGLGLPMPMFGPWLGF